MYVFIVNIIIDFLLILFSPLTQITSKGKIRALLQKNFLRMWRNVGVMLFIFVLPVMQVILFCLAIGRNPTGLHIAIVNKEMNDTVRHLNKFCYIYKKN